MQQSSAWEANSFSVSQEISCMLWKLKVCYIQNRLPPLHVLIHKHPADDLPSFFFMIHINNTFLSMPRTSKWPPSFMFPHHNPVHISLLAHPFPPTSSDHPDSIRWAEQITKLLFTHFIPVSCYNKYFPCLLLCLYCAYWIINVYYIPKYAQISGVNLC